MAKRKRRMSGKGTNTALLIGGGLLAAFALYEIMKSQTPATTIIRTTTPVSTSSSATTAAEIAAGSSVLTDIANNIFSDDGT
jgi:hypothetical protein